MKKLAFLFVAVAAFLLWLPRPTHAVTYYVQSTVSMQPWSGSTSCADVYGSNVAAGNLLIEAATVQLQTNATTISDSQGNTWSQLWDQNTTVTPSQEIVAWWAVAKSSAADTVTLGTSPSALIGCIAAEYTGFTGYQVDQVGSENNTSGSPSCHSPYITTTAAPEIIVGYSNNGDAFPDSMTLIYPPNNRQSLLEPVHSYAFAVLGDDYKAAITSGLTTDPTICAGGGSAGAIVSFMQANATRTPHHAHVY
jgi:hypothetical protein